MDITSILSGLIPAVIIAGFTLAFTLPVTKKQASDNEHAIAKIRKEVSDIHTIGATRDARMDAMVVRFDRLEARTDRQDTTLNEIQGDMREVKALLQSIKEEIRR